MKVSSRNLQFSVQQCLRISLTASLFVILSPGLAIAIGSGPGGQDVLHVPIAWCSVIGSPAQADPDLAGDTETDAILWRRHERPTDNIYINPAALTFRSAINNAWTVLDFPQIADPTTTLATPGDVRGEDVNAFGTEYNALVNACDASYAALGRANIGLTAVNVGLFHDAAGAYVGVLGWGGCNQPMGQGTTCGAPYDGRIAVIDNRYLHPASPDRRFPGTNLVFPVTDPFDQLTGHEFGHALGIEHTNGSALLMNPNPIDNNGDGQIDNLTFATGQTAVVRSSAAIVPGLEIDPPLQIDPGDFIADRIIDSVDNDEVKPYQNLSSVRLSVDKKLKRVFISNQLNGIHDDTSVPSIHWIVIDAKDDAKGADAEILRRIGLQTETLKGADTVIRIDVQFPRTEVTAWHWQNGELIETPRVFSEIQTLRMHPYLVTGKGFETPEIGDARIYDTVVASLPLTSTGIRLGEPVLIDVIIEADDGGVVLDRLNDNLREGKFLLEDPNFPHCFALEPAEPGGKAPLRVEGLLPRSAFHALVGPEEVARGETDSRGNVDLELPIPPDVTPGLHLVTVGVDKTALTADCVVQVGKERTVPGLQIPEMNDLLRRHQDLLKESLDAIREIGRISR